MTHIHAGIGLMMATALENNGATVYILGRRLEVLQKAAKEHAVGTQFFVLLLRSLSLSIERLVCRNMRN